MERNKNSKKREHRKKLSDDQPSPQTVSTKPENTPNNIIPTQSPLSNENWQDNFLAWTCMNVIIGLFPILMTVIFYFIGEYTIDAYVYFVGLVPDILLLFFTVCANICFYIIGLSGEKINATHKQLRVFFPFFLAIGTLLVYAFLCRKISEPEIHFGSGTWVIIGIDVVSFMTINEQIQELTKAARQR